MEGAVRSPTIRDIPMGGIGFASNAVTLRTTVGSCVAIVMGARHHGLYGMAHAVLPQSDGSPSPQYADAAVALLVQHFSTKGVELKHVEAHLFGGAEMFSTPQGKLGLVGRRNIDAALQALVKANVALRSQEVGSYFARRVTVDCATGTVTCERIAPDSR